mgnify:CR=1 FL=1
MSEISEFFPVTAGLVIGLVVLRIANVRLRTVALIALSVLAGFLASLISGGFSPARAIGMTLIGGLLYAAMLNHKTAIEELMLELKQRFTIAIVTHNLQQAKRVADMTGFLYVDTTKGGRTGYLVEYGPTAQIFEAPQERHTQEYIRGEFS